MLEQPRPSLRDSACLFRPHKGCRIELRFSRERVSRRLAGCRDQYCRRPGSSFLRFSSRHFRRRYRLP